MPSAELLQEEQASSQGDTEPLLFEDEEEEIDAQGEMDDDQDMLEAAATNALTTSSSETAIANIIQGDSLATGLQDTDMAGGGGNGEGDDEDAHADSDAEEDGQALDGDEDGMGSDDDIDQEGQISRSQTTAGNISPSKVAAGATFSDESELTDEPDEEDDEEEEEGDDEAEEEDEIDEDEAAKGLTALTSGQLVGLDDDRVDTSVATITTNSGLDGLAVLAAADAAEDSQGDEDTDNDSIAGSQARNKFRKPLSAIPRRTATRLNEVHLASPQLSEDEEEEDEEEDEEEEESGIDGQRSLLKSVTASSKGSRGLSSLIGMNIAKRSGKQGAAGLLAGAPSVSIEGLTSNVPSAATSREASPVLEEVDERQPDLDQEQGRDEVGTPMQEIDEAQVEDEPATDEAALRRQEAMDSLTKIEIGFALLRDKLYVERMDEVNKEGEMILDGTHPDLIHLSNLIENRRERKLKLVDKWFEQEEKQYERVARSEEAATWNNWRNEVVELRKEQMSEIARKRRKLDREKRSLDGPRPARRHQAFETELIRNPNHDRKMRLQYQNNGKRAKLRDENEMGAYVAFPDLRGAAEHESWMDMEQMGLVADARFVGMGSTGYYRPEQVSIDPYAMYPPPPMDQVALSGPNAAFVPYGIPPTAEHAPYEQTYANRTYIVDNYGRPLSPPPPPAAQHAFNKAAAQRGGPHSSYGATSKVNLVQEGESKLHTDNTPIRQRHKSPPLNPSHHQEVRPLPTSARGPSSHYPTQHHSMEQEASFYNPSKSSIAAIGSSSVSAPRQKVVVSGLANEGYHHYSR